MRAARAINEKAHGVSLKATLGAAVIVVMALALLVSGVLVTMSALLNRTTTNAAMAVESVRIVQQAEIDLLLHSRAKDAMLRRGLQQQMTSRLSRAWTFVSSDHEERLLAEVESQVANYLAGARDPALAPAEREARESAAFGALEALVAVNLEHAREAREEATAWTRRANLTAVVMSCVVLLGAVALLVWLRRGAIEPIFALATSMERFGKGDRDARAPQTGPAELQEMSRQFNEMAGALAFQRQAQIAFLGGVAHDLRNPLSVLKMAVAMIRPDRPLPPEPRLRQTVEKIARQIDRLERMATDFIDMARIESGQLELKRERHDARTLVADVVELFETSPAESRFQVSLPEMPVELSCDPLRIQQVLTNLISNAIKYSPPGSPIEVAVEQVRDEVAFCITDHGVGIPEEERQRVFEPFRRVGLSQESVPGVGLGLFVVRRIIEGHGGHIEVESTPGSGSTFRAWIPMAGGPAQVEPEEATREGGTVHPLH